MEVAAAGRDMATSNSFSIRLSCNDGFAVDVIVAPLEREGVVLSPAVQLLRVELTVEPLRVRERDRLTRVSLSDFDGVEFWEVVLFVFVVMSHLVMRPERGDLDDGV